MEALFLMKASVRFQTVVVVMHRRANRESNSVSARASQCLEEQAHHNAIQEALCLQLPLNAALWGVESWTLTAESERKLQ
jgi:hypothetical protein